MGSNFEKLKEHILPLSEADNFMQAKNEWKLSYIDLREELDQCPCGHTIKEICYIKNILNGKHTYVGNVCINKFLNIEANNIFTGLKRIKKDNSANPNEALIEYAWKRGYLFEKEYHFLFDTKRKRKLSEKQIAWKKRINLRIINETVVRDVDNDFGDIEKMKKQGVEAKEKWLRERKEQMGRFA